MKNRTLTLTILLIAACSGGRGNDVIMEEAARIHNETMALAVLVEKAINNGEADSMNTISNDSIVQMLEIQKTLARRMSDLSRRIHP